jgi:hypothetical protein
LVLRQDLGDEPAHAALRATPSTAGARSTDTPRLT